MVTEARMEAKARLRKKARERAKATKAYQREMRPWYWRHPFLALLLITIALFAAVLYIHSL